MDDKAVRALRRAHEGHAHRRSVQVAASRRHGGWNPEIVLIGRERLGAARALGHGTILWFDAFAHPVLVGKRAFADTGYVLWHVSSPGHGILKAPLAQRFLNPRMIEVELRYLAGRIVFDSPSMVSATRKIVGVLDDNGIVSITNTGYYGKTIHTRIFGVLNLEMARTPLKLAASRGAALLPVSVIETEPFQRYEVTVGPDLAPRGLTGPLDPVEAIAAAYAEYLMPLIRAHPAQWGNWNGMGALL